MWVLIGDAAKLPPRPGDFMTNCRSETVATKVTFKGPWLRGQRCIVPATSFDEPRYLDGLTNTWWRFQRTDGAPWALAGIWNERSDWDAWLHGTVEDAWRLIRLPAMEVFDHGPAAPVAHQQSSLL